MTFFLKIMVFVYFAISLILFLFQDKLIFFPQTLDSNTRSALEKNSLQFQKENLNLQGWYEEGKGDQKHYLLIYYGGNAEEVSESFREPDQHLGSRQQLALSLDQAMHIFQ